MVGAGGEGEIECEPSDGASGEGSRGCDTGDAENREGRCQLPRGAEGQIRDLKG